MGMVPAANDYCIHCPSQDHSQAHEIDQIVQRVIAIGIAGGQILQTILSRNHCVPRMTAAPFPPFSAL